MCVCVCIKYVSKSFVIYKNKIENQFDKMIKILRSNKGDEYDSSDFVELTAKFGIIHQETALYNPQQNEVANKKNRTLKNRLTLCLLVT